MTIFLLSDNNTFAASPASRSTPSSSRKKRKSRVLDADDVDESSPTVVPAKTMFQKMLNQGFVRSVSRFMIPELIARKAILELFRIYNGPGNCPVWMPEIEPIELTLFFAVSKQHVRTIARWWASWRGTCSRGLWKRLGLRLNWKSMLNELQRLNTAWYIQRYIAINLSCYIPCYIDKVWYTIFKRYIASYISCYISSDLLCYIACYIAK